MNKSDIHKIDRLLNLLYERNFDPELNKSDDTKWVSRTDIIELLNFSEKEVDRFVQMMENREKNGLKYISDENGKIKLEDLGVEHYYAGGFKEEYKEIKSKNLWDFINSRVISLLSLIFSIAALYMSTVNFIEEGEELIFIHANKCLTNDSLVLRKSKEYYITYQEYKFLLVNNSKNPVSILEVNIENHQYDNDNNASNQYFSSGNIYKEDFSNLHDLPIKLEPSDKTSIGIKVPIILDNNHVVSKIDILENKKLSNLQDLYKLLVINDSLDIFGNTVIPTFDNGRKLKHVYIDFTDNFYNKEMKIKVLTTKGTIIEEDLRFYPGFTTKGFSYSSIGNIFSN